LQQTSRPSSLSKDPAKQEFAIGDLLLLIRKRRVLILILTVGMTLLAISMSTMRGKRYTATGQLEIQPGSAAALKASISSMLGGMSSLDSVLESDIHIISSDTLLMEVAKTLKLQDNLEFLGGRQQIRTSRFGGRDILLFHGNLDDPYVRSAILKILKQNLSVQRIPRTQMIQISYQSKSPQLSASIVNTIESEYIENNFKKHYDSTKEVTKWLTQQIEDLRVIVQGSQDQMVDLQKKLGISSLDPSHSLIVNEITNLEKGATDSTEQRILGEARYRILQSVPPDQIQDSATQLGTDGAQGLLSTLRAERANLSSQLANLQQVYGPNYPQVKQLQAQLQSVNREIEKQQSRVVTQAKNAAAMAQSAESKAKSLRDGRIQQLYGQRDDLVQYGLLSQEYESNRTMYESILSRLREAAVDAGLDSADVSVVDLASLPVDPSSMSTPKLGLIGLFFGAFLGIAISLFIEKIDTRMQDSRQIQDLLGLPAISVIPQTEWKFRSTYAEESGEDHLPVGPEILWDSRSAFAEAIRTLRTSIQLSSTARLSRVIAFTSSQPGEGKSTLVSNLAAALAQAGKHTILVDSDMRRPSIMWRFNLQTQKGLSEYLTGLEPLEAVIQTHPEISNLQVISSGSVPPLPADLLASDQMKFFMQQLREKYDYVLLDTPPVLSVTDPLIVSSLVDGIVLVIRQGACTRAMLARTGEMFRDVGAKVYGFVLNGVNASLPEYYGYLGYYSYDYKSRG
jgi:capsular exopolysaccharide synthesis family protein